MTLTLTANLRNPPLLQNAVVILSSVIILCISTLPEMETVDFFLFECVFNIIFTAELATRIAVARSKTTTLSDPFTMFDFLAVAPFWLSLAIGEQGRSMDFLRSLRILRLLKLARHYEGTIILHRTLQLSGSALSVPFFFLFLAVLVFSSFIFYVELSAGRSGGGGGGGGDSSSGQGHRKDRSDFDSIPSAIWFMVVTMTTVG